MREGLVSEIEQTLISGGLYLCSSAIDAKLARDRHPYLNDLNQSHFTLDSGFSWTFSTNLKA